MTVLRRRWKLAVAIAVLLVALLFGGGYLYLVIETGSPPPPLSLDQNAAVAGASPDGTWRCAAGGQIRIVGRWIEEGALRADGALVQVPPPVDLTELAAGRRLQVKAGDSLVLGLLWRGSSLRIDGRSGSRAIRSICRR